MKQIHDVSQIIAPRVAKPDFAKTGAAAEQKRESAEPVLDGWQVVFSNTLPTDHMVSEIEPKLTHPQDKVAPGQAKTTPNHPTEEGLSSEISVAPPATMIVPAQPVEVQSAIPALPTSARPTDTLPADLTSDRTGPTVVQRSALTLATDDPNSFDDNNHNGSDRKRAEIPAAMTKEHHLVSLAVGGASFAAPLVAVAAPGPLETTIESQPLGPQPASGVAQNHPMAQTVPVPARVLEPGELRNIEPPVTPVVPDRASARPEPFDRAAQPGAPMSKPVSTGADAAAQTAAVNVSPGDKSALASSLKTPLPDGPEQGPVSPGNRSLPPLNRAEDIPIASPAVSGGKTPDGLPAPAVVAHREAPVQPLAGSSAPLPPNLRVAEDELVHRPVPRDTAGTVGVKPHMVLAGMAKIDASPGLPIHKESPVFYQAGYAPPVPASTRVDVQVAAHPPIVKWAGPTPSPANGTDSFAAATAEFLDRPFVETLRVETLPLRDNMASGGGAGRTPVVIPEAMQAQIARQLVGVASLNPQGQVDIVLSPEELGRVRMQLSPTEGAITVLIHAERPETTELMRRHIDELAREFEALGFADIGFSFGAEGGDAHDGETGEKDLHPSGTLTAPDAGSAGNQTTLTDTDSLDLRL